MWNNVGLRFDLSGLIMLLVVVVKMFVFVVLRFVLVILLRLILLRVKLCFFINVLKLILFEVIWLKVVCVLFVLK